MREKNNEIFVTFLVISKVIHLIIKENFARRNSREAIQSRELSTTIIRGLEENIDFY